MIGKTVVALAILAIGAVGMGMAGDDASVGRNASDKFEPVMPVYALMVEQDRHFEKIRNLIRKDQEERFAKLRHAGLALAEMANVNTFHENATEHADYRQWTLDMKADALKLAGFAKESKLDDVKRMAKKINTTCNACHDKYQ